MLGSIPRRTFQLEKTDFTKTRRLAADAVPLVVKGQLINESRHLKILGAISDHRLRYDVHVACVAKKGLRATLALKPPRGMRPSTARQLFISIIAPSIDYASHVWC
jgi:hypothetical protein